MQWSQSFIDDPKQDVNPQQPSKHTGLIWEESCLA